LTITPVGQSGLQGVQEGLQRAQDAAALMVDAGVTGSLDQIVEAAVELNAAQLQVAASVRVIEADADIRGQLIDVLA
jgi:hypothetical protein